MRVITGTLKGRTLKGPKNIRPVTGMIKEAIFNVLQSIDWGGAEVLDLFCGAGNFGIEAVSRGARQVTFLDKSHESRRFVVDNLRGVQWVGEVIIDDFRQGIKKLFKKGRKFTIIFADPPFDMDFGTPVVDAMREYPILKDDGILVLRVRDTETVDIGEGFSAQMRKYGDSVVYIITVRGGS